MPIWPLLSFNYACIVDELAKVLLEPRMGPLIDRRQTEAVTREYARAEQQSMDQMAGALNTRMPGEGRAFG
jgi:hypothetical protein